MAAQLFGAAIDSTRVRVFNRRYLPFGLQPRNCAMTPNGCIYFDKSCCLLDFAAGSTQARHWFMHEMVHVWQHQLGYPVRLRGALRIGLSYQYTLAPGRTLADYNMEAQGDLLADYFALKFMRAPECVKQQRYVGDLGLYEEVLRGFLAAPLARENLPRGVWGRWLG